MAGKRVDTYVRRRIVAIVVAVNVLAPVAVQVDLAMARHHLTTATAASHAAGAAAQVSRAQADADRALLAVRRGQEGVARAQLAVARVRLKATHTTERQLRDTLHAARQHLHTAEVARRAALDEITRQQGALPVAKGCVLDALRTLSRASNPSDADPPATASAACVRAFAHPATPAR